MLKIRFIISVAATYTLTAGAIGVILLSPQLFGIEQTAAIEPEVAQATKLPVPPKIISGIPVEISISARNIDLPVDQGRYDPETKSWTLSTTHAQYAVVSAIANNRAGTTFIYGHGTDTVFGRIGTSQPPKGTLATVQTDTGHTFTYSLQSISNLKPSDTWILKNSTIGNPRLIIQTCTGAFSEWRTMFIFSLKEVH